MQSTVERSVAERRFALMVMAAFALVTVALAIIGVNGVVSYAASQRSREIGIRQALGAAPSSAVLLVLRGAATVVFAGVVAGLVFAAFGAPLLGSLLFEAPRFDALAFVAVPLLVAGVAAASSLIPAIRAARASPVNAMRAS
jgi:ABC-type antimicrobial peptide transport system permease subunit